MCKSVLIMAPAVMMLIACNNRSLTKDQVPSVVRNAIGAKYPFANDVEWKKIGSVYEAEMALNDGTDVTARIDAGGKVLMQKKDVSTTQLDASIRNIINSEYRDYRVDDVEMIVAGGKTFYQVELHKKGNKEVNLVFSSDGKKDDQFLYWD